MSHVDVVEEEIPLQETLSHFWKDETFHDIQLKCNDGVIIGANRYVLSIRSKVFQKMLLGHYKESCINEVVVQYNSRAVRALLEYIHTDEFKLGLGDKTKNPEEEVEKLTTLVSLASASHFYQLPKLHKKASDSIIQLMDEIPSLSLVVLEACTANDSTLRDEVKTRALSMIRTNVDSIKQENNWLPAISINTLNTMLQDDQKTGMDQHILFEILQHWAGNDEERKNVAKDLLGKHICLEKLDPNFLTSSVIPTGFASTQQLMQAFQVQALLANKEHAMFSRKSAKFSHTAKAEQPLEANPCCTPAMHRGFW
ncbi:expressed unknown protein [Seminavis robusta]|uniref:BTB domain-containing protein n=1 Tax=Seminavis robusta TaxID=568900 RepID=A0A9N8D8J9_9STRA|nr:expressed unknown protein [Seminavis robusta]|eukprot:Sro2_g001750.1 n/a (312) ;mRNA; f:238175-239110